MPGHPVGSGPKGGDTRAAAGRAHRPRQNPNAMQGAGRANTNSRRQIRHILARARPQMTKKRGPIFLGRVGDPLPPPPNAPRPAGGAGSDPPRQGWRPPQTLLCIMAWRKRCGGATPAPRGAHRHAAAAPPRCPQAPPPVPRGPPPRGANRARVSLARLPPNPRSPSKGGSRSEGPVGEGPPPRRGPPVPPPRPAACKLCPATTWAAPPGTRIRPLYPLSSLLLETRSPLKGEFRVRPASIPRRGIGRAPACPPPPELPFGGPVHRPGAAPRPAAPRGNVVRTRYAS